MDFIFFPENMLKKLLNIKSKFSEFMLKTFKKLSLKRILMERELF
jgi:hypothetical protein